VAMHLDALGLPVTYLASAMYMENLLIPAEAIRLTGTIAAPAGQGRVGWIAAADVAQAAARVLTSLGHENMTYVLSGPEALGYPDVAARLSAVFARQVGYEDQAPEQARELMRANGLSRWQAAGDLERFEWIRQGGAATVTGTVRELTGADPRPLEEWLAQSRASFA
jgi:NAD(P)H dehydrogenase (quinone)